MNFFKKNKNIISVWSLVFALIAGIVVNYNHQIDYLKNKFIKEKHLEALSVADYMATQFNYIHQLIRSIGTFSSIREIDRYAKNFSEESRNSIRQLYRYAFLNVALSEIYIVPNKINPDAIDRVTNKSEEPILMFDDFIAADEGKKENESKLEEVEIEEYRLLSTQMDFFNGKYPTISDVKEKKFPVISGKEVITCDNSEFTQELLKKGDNTLRKGLVISTPVYDKNGKFHAAITAVIRTAAMAKQLPKRNYFLFLNNDVGFYNDPSKELLNNLSQIKNNQKANLIYSEKIKVAIDDEAGQWQLISLASDNDFYFSSEVIAQKRNAIVLSFILVLGGFGLSFYFFKGNIRKEMIFDIAHSLMNDSEKMVSMAKDLKQNSSAINDSIIKQSTSSTEIAESVEEINQTVELNTNVAGVLKKISERSNLECEQGRENYLQIQSFLKEIHESVNEIKYTVEKSQKNIDKVIDFLSQVEDKTKIINEIVFQTRILSFNAAVEAARAGDKGSGFAVVAEEVGKLALLSGEAAKEISQLLSTGVQGTKDIFKEMNNSIQEAVVKSNLKIVEGQNSSKEFSIKLQNISESTAKIFHEISNIEVALLEQSKGIQQINIAVKINSNSIHEINPRTQGVAIAAANVEDCAQELDTHVESLKKLV